MWWAMFITKCLMFVDDTEIYIFSAICSLTIYSHTVLPQIKTEILLVGFQVPTVTNMKMAVFWMVALFSLVEIC